MKKIYELEEEENKGIVIRGDDSNCQYATISFDRHERKIKIHEFLEALKEIYGE